MVFRPYKVPFLFRHRSLLVSSTSVLVLVRRFGSRTKTEDSGVRKLLGCPNKSRSKAEWQKKEPNRCSERPFGQLSARVLESQTLSEQWGGRSDTPAVPPLINPPTHRWMTSRQMDARRSSSRRSAALRRWIRGINSVPASLFSVKATCSALPSWTG